MLTATSEKSVFPIAYIPEYSKILNPVKYIALPGNTAQFPELESLTKTVFIVFTSLKCSKSVGGDEFAPYT